MLAPLEKRFERKQQDGGKRKENTGREGKVQEKERCRCLRNCPTARDHGVHLLLPLAMATCREIHEKVAGDKWERKLLPDSGLPEVGLCPTKVNERVYTPLMRFIVLNKKISQP